MPTAALSMTVTILSGHLIGANRPEALFRFGQRLALAAALALGFGAGLLFVFRVPVAEMLSTQPEVVRQAAQFLVFACAGIPLKTYSMLVNGAFAGAGATRVSCKVNCGLNTVCENVRMPDEPKEENAVCPKSETTPDSSRLCWKTT